MYLKKSEESESATPAKAEPKPASPALPPPRISRARKWLFRLAAVLLAPLLFFGLLEGILRIAGYGYPAAYFLDGSKLEREDVWIDSTDFGRWVFPGHDEPIPKPVSFILPRNKSERTFRIFV